MKKLFIAFFFVCLAVQMSAQRVVDESDKYYELGFVQYMHSSIAFGIQSYSAYAIYYNTNYKDRMCKDENGKEIYFKSFIACINYFMSKGWTVFNINLGENWFFIKREITKEESEKMTAECIDKVK